MKSTLLKSDFYRKLYNIQPLFLCSRTPSLSLPPLSISLAPLSLSHPSLSHPSLSLSLPLPLSRSPLSLAPIFLSLLSILVKLHFFYFTKISYMFQCYNVSRIDSHRITFSLVMLFDILRTLKFLYKQIYKNNCLFLILNFEKKNLEMINHIKNLVQ